MGYFLDSIVADVSFELDVDEEPIMKLRGSFVDEEVTSCCFLLEADQLKTGDFFVMSPHNSVGSLLLIVQTVNVYFFLLHF